jgi:hypothetical protein
MNSLNCSFSMEEEMNFLIVALSSQETKVTTGGL